MHSIGASYGLKSNSFVGLLFVKRNGLENERKRKNIYVHSSWFILCYIQNLLLNSVCTLMSFSLDKTSVMDMLTKQVHLAYEREHILDLYLALFSILN